MAETLIDPPAPPPPTVRDAVKPTAARRPRSGTASPPPSKRGCFTAAAAVTLVSFMVAAALLYVFVFRYEPTAGRHLPSNVNVAFRVEIAQVALFGPVRKHLLQLDTAGSSRAAGGPSRFDRLEAETGLDVRSDLRELIVGSVDGRGWVILAGGRIPRGRFIEGIERTLRADGVTSFEPRGELLVGPGGLTLAQADDGTIIVATSIELARSALPASNPNEHVPLREDAALSFALTSSGLGGLSNQPAMRAQSELFAGIASASGSLTLDSAPKLSLTAEAAPGVDAASLQAKTNAAIGVLRLMLLLLPDRYGEKGALASASVTATPTGIAVNADWPYEGLERACDDLARLLGAALPRSSP